MAQIFLGILLPYWPPQDAVHVQRPKELRAESPRVEAAHRVLGPWAPLQAHFPALPGARRLPPSSHQAACVLVTAVEYIPNGLKISCIQVGMRAGMRTSPPCSKGIQTTGHRTGLP
jgi:hypothetical protein